VLITLATAAVAVVLGRSMWRAYMDTPWTRDGTVRAYIVAMAAEVAGRIVELPVVDNQFVHRGDLLLVIDPTDYRIGVELAEASLKQAKIEAENEEREARRRRPLAGSAISFEQQQVYDTRAVAAQARGHAAEASLAQARVNLERTHIRSPVNGWVTNLQARLGDYATVGRNQIAVVDADSFWVDGYFEETKLHAIREGDPARVKLMGHHDVVRAHVGSIARGIPPTGQVRARSDDRSLAMDDGGHRAGDRRRVLSGRVRAARRGLDHPVSAALGRGPARPEHQVAATALRVGGADARDPSGGRAALGTLSRRPHGRHGREPCRDSDTP